MDSEDLSHLLAETTRRHRVPGAQLAVLRGGSLVTARTGETASGTGEPVTDSSLFSVGSITKPFTATLAMMLVDDGELALDTPLREDWDLVAGTSDAEEPGYTLRQVLSHTSGLACDSDVAGHDVRSRARWVAAHCGTTNVLFEPGTMFSYSGDGYVLLGHLVETITRMDWWEAVDSLLNRPLGIAAASVVDGGTRRDVRLVSGHAVRSDPRAVVPLGGGTVTPLSAPEGGLGLSAADLVTFARLHLDDGVVPRLLNPRLLEAMRRDHTAGLTVRPFGMADAWGLGWGLFHGPGPEWYGHDGAADGMSCHLRFDPTSGVVVAMTTNATTGYLAWEDVLAGLASHGLDVANRSGTRLPAAATEVPTPVGCAGTYANGGLRFTIAERDGEFQLLVNGHPHSRLTSYDGHRFTLTAMDSGAVQTGRFLPDPGTGRVRLAQCLDRLVFRRE
ncbi:MULTISPECIES: serine hydrolase domain-containing protein [Actinoalloteichus]|uniref:serine hydrolase domain-containing protein n=2 Tax=Pseudonocardiaceae TaxID=2070 RepID=UPI00068976D7|nr:serine hydrolase domain-containing protein [Actinoalloteichus caeruleus]